MAADGVIVRRLTSIENFGSIGRAVYRQDGHADRGVVRLNGRAGCFGRSVGRGIRLAYLNAHFQTGLSNP